MVPVFFIRKAPTRWLPRTPFSYDQREGSGEPPNGFADAKRGQCFGQQFVASLTAQCSCQGGHQPPPSLNYHLKKLHFFKYFSNFFWATFLNTTKINIVMIFWKFIYISRNIGKSVETWGSGWGDTYILMGGIFCGGETTPPPKLPQFFSENIFFAWLRTKIIYETTGIFRKNSSFRFSQKWPIRHPRIWNFSTQNQCLVCHDDSGPPKNGGLILWINWNFSKKIDFSFRPRWF